MPAAAAIIGGLIAAATSVGTGVAKKVQQDRAQDEARTLGNINRADTLKREQDIKDLNRDKMFQRESEFVRDLGYKKQQDKLNRGERIETKAYGRKQDTYNKALSVIANNKGLQNSMAKYWGGNR